MHEDPSKIVDLPQASANSDAACTPCPYQIPFQNGIVDERLVKYVRQDLQPPDFDEISAVSRMLQFHFLHMQPLSSFMPTSCRCLTTNRSIHGDSGDRL